jgi:hypothetical protein
LEKTGIAWNFFADFHVVSSLRLKVTAKVKALEYWWVNLITCEDTLAYAVKTLATEAVAAGS